MTPPLITVVIPLYNGGFFISDALNSVLSQTVQDFEIIVVNDGSTDDGVEIVQSFGDSRIRLINQSNQGDVAARNQGVRNSSTKIIAFLDADDQWRPDFLETILKLLEKYPQAGAYATGIVEIIDNKEVFQQYFTIPNNGFEGLIPDFFKSAILEERFITSSSVAVKKSVFFDLSGFKEGPAWGSDGDFWARIALKYPVAFNSKICSTYFIRHAADKTKQRITITPEHPFIKSGTEYVSQNLNSGRDFTDVILYIDKLRILSARLNLMYGHSKSARGILIDCTHDYYKNQKNFLLMWTLMPERLYKPVGQYLFRFCISCVIFIKNVSRSLNYFIFRLN